MSARRIQANWFFALVLAPLAYLATFGYALSQEIRHVLAPTGTLRIGVYRGSPTSEVSNKSGKIHGVSVELGRALGAKLGVPVKLVEFSRVPEIVDAIAAGKVDFTVTDATPARAKLVAFTQPVLAIELGFLVPADSKITSLSAFKDAVHRVGVTRGSTSTTHLPPLFPKAVIVPVPTVRNAGAMFQKHAIDAYATNKAILFEVSDTLPGSRVLPGNWGYEHMAVAYPKGREAAAKFLNAFVAESHADGLIAGAAKRAGLRGQAPDAAKH